MAPLSSKDITQFIKQNYRLEGGRKLSSEHLKEIQKAALEHGALSKDYAKPFTKLIGGVANPITSGRFVHGAVKFHQAVEAGELTIDGKRLVARKGGVGPVTFRGVAKEYATGQAAPPTPTESKENSALVQQRLQRRQMVQRQLAQARAQARTEQPGSALVAGRTGGTLPLTSVSRFDKQSPGQRAQAGSIAPLPPAERVPQPPATGNQQPEGAGQPPVAGDEPTETNPAPPPADNQLAADSGEPETPSADDLPTEKPDDLEIG